MTKKLLILFDAFHDVDVMDITIEKKIMLLFEPRTEFEQTKPQIICAAVCFVSGFSIYSYVKINIYEYEN